MATAMAPCEVTVTAPSSLMHICRQHPRVTDPPCSPGCLGFCGAPLTLQRTAVEGSWDLSEVCNVCELMSS